jgi:hypothetical protein
LVDHHRVCRVRFHLPGVLIMALTIMALTINDAIACPFCGDKDLGCESLAARAVVTCNECGAMGPEARTVDGAVTKWNHLGGVKTQVAQPKFIEPSEPLRALSRREFMQIIEAAKNMADQYARAGRLLDKKNLDPTYRVQAEAKRKRAFERFISSLESNCR